MQNALIKWIDRNARRFRSPSVTDGAPIRLRANLPVTFRFGFLCIGPVPLCATVHSAVGFFLGPDCARQSRTTASGAIASSLRAQIPEAGQMEAGFGARTVLVLEEDDLSLTNHFLVADALVQVEATTPNAPDEVFMVSTDMEQIWWVVCLRGPGRVDGEPMPHREFDPNELTKLTSRNSRGAAWQPVPTRSTVPTGFEACEVERLTTCGMRRNLPGGTLRP